MIKVTPYLQTKGSEKFKKFLTQPFTIDMLYPVFNEKSCETLFDGWRGKDMFGWHKFTNDDGFILEIFPTRIAIKKNAKDSTSYSIGFPSTINKFIDDVSKFGIQLYWTQWIDDNFEPKEYLHVDEIKPYFVDLLAKLDKSFELQ
jgi:hypothetical protein